MGKSKAILRHFLTCNVRVLHELQWTSLRWVGINGDGLGRISRRAHTRSLIRYPIPSSPCCNDLNSPFESRCGRSRGPCRSSLACLCVRRRAAVAAVEPAASEIDGY